MAAREEAWEGKDPGSVRVLLANPQWERRLLRFLELSGVGRVVEDGEDEEETRAARMDEWIIWALSSPPLPILSTRPSSRSGFLYSLLLRGTHTPGYEHSAMLRV
jgi:hypothetical protein